MPLAPPRPEHLHAIAVDGPVAVIGDVHGDAVRLHRLLRKLEGRTILFAGDLNDRGPDTRGVIDLMLGVGAAGVRGNHEEWLIALAQGRFDTFALHPRMGGAATLLSYGIEARSPSAVEAEAHRIPFAHRDFLWSLPVAIDLTVCGQSYWLTHAGVPPGPRFSEALPRCVQRKKRSLVLSFETRYKGKALVPYSDLLCARTRFETESSPCLASDFI